MSRDRGPTRKLFRDVAIAHLVEHRVRRRGFTVIELVIVALMIGTLAAIGIPVYASALDKAKLTRAIADIHTFDREIRAYYLFQGRYPNTLLDIGRANWRDPYGNPYEYLNIFDNKPPKGKMRKDHSLVPLNNDYDLYSKGKDGDTRMPLSPPQSHDDIIRANDGGFVGPASEF